MPNFLWRITWQASTHPWFHHLYNIIIHALNGALLGSFCYSLTKRKSAAWLTGLVFVTAAVLTEAVSGIVGIADVLGGLGAALTVLGLTTPVVLKPVYRVWMALAVVLGFVMTRVILTVVYYLVMTPIGLVMRLLGKDPLDRRPDPGAASYWIEKTYPDDSKERLEKYY